MTTEAANRRCGTAFRSWPPAVRTDLPDPVVGTTFGDVNDETPIELLGLDDERDLILARRAGEPSFVWVQDLEDAYQAAAERGGVDIVVSRRVYDELRAAGVSPLELQGLRVV